MVLGEDRFALAWAASAALAVVAVFIGLRVPETRPAEGTEAGQPGRYRLIHPGGFLPGFILLAGTWGMAGFFVFAKPYGESLGLGAVGPLFLLYGGHRDRHPRIDAVGPGPIREAVAWEERRWS